MPRRRRVRSELDQALTRYGISPGLLSGLSPADYEHFRKLQRISTTKDEAGRKKFDRRTRRDEARILNEHGFVKGQRFSEPDFYEWYLHNPGSDGLAQVERFYFKDFEKGIPLSFVISDLRGFRKSDKTFARHFSSEEISHISRHLSIKALRLSKLGA